jgi:release factor glutamine methyltransferase
LRAAGSVYAEDEAAVLLTAAAEGGDLGALVARRVRGVPLEVVVGWAMFCGHRIAVDPGVFVPRRKTELLAETAAGALPAGGVLVDLCCGTGAIALVAALAIDAAEVHAADVDPAAVACARRNLARVGGAVHHGDLYEALPRRLQARVDVLTVNAPYVPTDEVRLMPPEAREHEPLVALDGGADGVALHRRVAVDAPHWLAPGGVLLVETCEGLAHLTCRAVEAAGLRAEVLRDEDRDATVVKASVDPATLRA